MLGLQGRSVLTQSLGSYQQSLEGQPNASSARVAESSSPVTFPDGKVLRASDHAPEDRPNLIQGDS